MSEVVVDLLQTFRTILCICPCCGDIVRLSELHLRYKGPTPRTWLDTYDSKEKILERKEVLFEEKERRLRDAAVERGRKRVPRMICRCLDQSIARFNYNPYDIKALLHPVDFVVFNGLNDREKLEDIAFLSKATQNMILNKIRKSIEAAIERERYDLRVARVSIEGKVQME
jgi:predicted Holliday junction resolvase-like endonuclease